MGFVGVAPGTTTITLPDGTTVALVDWIDDKHYGTVQFNNAQAVGIDAFSTGRSQQIPGGARANSKVDTNIPRAGENGLPMSWEMLVFALGIKPIRAMRGLTATPAVGVLADGGGALSDPVGQRAWFNVERVMYLEYKYNGKTYTEGTMSEYPASMGTQLFTTNANIEQINNGVPSPRDRQALVLPIHERENLGYKMAFQPEAAPAIAQAASDGGVALGMLDVKIYKFGLIKRTVV